MRDTGRGTWSAFLLAPLLLLLTLGACGDNPKPTPDGGVGDGGTEQLDAGTDQPDSGTGFPQCGTSLAFTETVANTALLQDTSVDILERLRAIPGLTVRENPNGATVPAGYRFFLMEYDQPADHSRPECQRFQQRLTLLHTSDTAPMVLYTSGYYVSTGTARRELTVMLGANQLSVEHRFFLPSRPEPADWGQLTLRQSADDFHRIVQAFKPIYGGRWISTGASKGGETVVFFRRFYPGDVDATVAYVAPLAQRDDARFPAFQDAVGGDAQAACRERIHTFQRTVLERREEMLGLLRTYAQEKGLTYTQLGFEKALEHAVIETYFAFWQYRSPARCDVFPGNWTVRRWAGVDTTGLKSTPPVRVEPQFEEFAPHLPPDLRQRSAP